LKDRFTVKTIAVIVSPSCKLRLLEAQRVADHLNNLGVQAAYGFLYNEELRANKR
jgi:hypothetical protein